MLKSYQLKMRNLLNNCENDIDFLEWGGVTYILKAVMQYNVSDLRAAYDQYGLSDADQLVVGGVDDNVMKIGADGQLVPVE